MSLNDSPSSERVHIGFFGMRNAGKSSVVNAVTNQELAVVSDKKGTTTDPVRKAMEILPLGPVVIIDTPGLDDTGALGEMRVKKARQILTETDIAVLVIDGKKGANKLDEELIEFFQKNQLPYVVAYNKADMITSRQPVGNQALYISAATGENIDELKERVAVLIKDTAKERRLVADLLSPGDAVMLIVPIDEAAPKQRLILPQQMVLRDILDAHCSAVVCQDTEQQRVFDALNIKPKLVITDSQVFSQVAGHIPPEVMLTSFSILLARYKGDLEVLVKGAAKLARLKSGDRVLIAEGCTHHRQCDDIGTVKLPAWIEQFTGVRLEYTFCSGGDFPEDIARYSLIVHCGGCMLNEKSMRYRIAKAVDAGVPIVNYGVAIAMMHGILERSLQPFPERYKCYFT